MCWRMWRDVEGVGGVEDEDVGGYREVHCVARRSELVLGGPMWYLEIRSAGRSATVCLSICLHARSAKGPWPEMLAFLT